MCHVAFLLFTPSPVNRHRAPINGIQLWSKTAAVTNSTSGGQRWYNRWADHIRSSTPADQTGQRWLTASQGGSTVGPGQVGYWAGSSIGLDRAKYWAESSSGHGPGRSTASSSSTQNVAFVSENTSSTNELDEFDFEEMDLKWQVAMISMRLKKFYKKTGRKLQIDAKEPVGFDKTKVECYNCHKTGHFAKECRSKGNQDSRRRDAWNTGNKAKDNERRSGSETKEKIRFMKIDLDDKTDVLTYHKKLLAEAEKEKEELKAKVEKWHNFSKNLNILLNSQMSARDKAVLGYGNQMNKGVLSYENKVFGSLFYSRSSDIENSPVNDRYAEGMHAVPPSMTGIYIPSGPDKEIDNSQFTYGPKQSKPSESDARSSNFNSCESNCSEETYKSMHVPIINEPKVSPKPDKKDCSGLMSKKLGLGFEYTKKACFVCGSFSHLIRDCDFHEKRMAKQAELNNRMSVLTRTGRIQVNTARTSGTNTVNTARHNFNSQAVPTNAARKVNTVKPIMNNARPKTGFHKTLSSFRRPFNRTTTLRTIFSNPKVNTADVKAVSAVWGKRETVVKPSDYPQRALKDKAIVDCGCSRHMTGNKAYLTEYQEFNGGLIAFGGSKGYITGKGKIKTRKLNFKDVCFVKELQHFNLFSVSQMCDKKNSESSYKHALGPKEANHSVAESAQDYFVLPIWSSYTSTVKSSKAKNEGEALRKEFAQNTEDLLLQAGAARASSTNTVNTASTPVSTVSPSGGLSFTDLTNTDQDDSEIPNLEDSYDNPNDGIFTNASYDDEGTVADFTNLEPIVNISPIPTSRIHSIHPSNQILRDQNQQFKQGAKIEAIRIFLAFASYMGFIVYQMDVKSAFLYGTIDEEVYVSQPLGFVDPKYPKKVYKVVEGSIYLSIISL
ncbi:putative ribonuclease H-like domain-containing protein [Tanacetum coccineum]|uniref:Ribonuclease H-like domain-containing protein n=1 Tax=Tanacetum coccineum TaxID=301880 RepID=A0ABQ5HJH5_9ASTR